MLFDILDENCVALVEHNDPENSIVATMNYTHHVKLHVYPVICFDTGSKDVGIVVNDNMYHLTQSATDWRQLMVYRRATPQE